LSMPDQLYDWSRLITFAPAAATAVAMLADP
jgi:hypothetical protein